MTIYIYISISITDGTLEYLNFEENLFIEAVGKISLQN